MSKPACILSLLALAFFASGCESPTNSETKKVPKEELNIVELKEPNLIPLFVASITNPDDTFVHRILLKTDSEYARANKFQRQDTFALKKTGLLKSAAAVKGKMVLLRLTGPLRSQDYNQDTHSYSLMEGHNFFYDQAALGGNPPFEIRLVFDSYPKTLSSSEAMARAISSVNDGWDNVMLLMAANVVPQSCESLNADWDGKVDLSQFHYLHVAPIDAVVYVKSPQGGLSKVGTMVFGDAVKAAQVVTNQK